MRSYRFLLPCLALLASCTPVAVGGGGTPPVDVVTQDLPAADVPAADAPPADAAVEDASPADVPVDDAQDVPSVDAPAPVDVVMDDVVAVDAPAPDVVAADVVAADVPADGAVTRCVSARMCPGQVCDTERGLCVDCLNAIDCTMGQRCIANRCVDPPPTCRSDRDCSSRNQVCSPTRMECVDCASDRDCDMGSYCDPDSACRPQVCTPDAVTCVEGSTRRVCNANGSRYSDTPCPTGDNATATCAAGACGITCAAGFADCDMNPSTGCEAELRASSAHCGRCGNACGAGESCVNGACMVGPCPAGQTRCAGVCRDLRNDAANCGGCGVTCSIPNGVPVCRDGCAVGACVTGFGDCNGRAGDGCETALMNNPAHCGACGRACTVDQTCSGTACVARSCNGSQISCGGTCVDPFTSPQHCGGCNRPCSGGQTCFFGMCVTAPTCGPGLTLCGINRCANLQTDPANCGACDRACAAGQSCIAGVCAMTPPRLRFTITWTPTADVDLWVLTPSGMALSYSTRMVEGGVLDTDSLMNGPENATWAGTPPSGRYIVCAIPYGLRGAPSVNVRYEVYRDGVSVANGTRSYTAAAPSGTRCTAGSSYEVARYTY